MIKTENEYQECLRRLEQDRKFLAKQKDAILKAGLSKAEAQVALEPTISFHQQLVEEVRWYEHVKRREFGTMRNLAGLGQWLIALRIANGVTQATLAKRLSVSEALVSRDEKNEYHGITLERAQRILDALGEQIISQIADKPVQGLKRQSRKLAKGKASLTQISRKSAARNIVGASKRTTKKRAK